MPMPSTSLISACLDASKTKDLCRLHACSSVMPQKTFLPVRVMSMAAILSLSGLAVSVARAQEPATKAFQQRNVPLSWIFNEWRRNGNTANTYLCVCDQDRCNTQPNWPFRSFGTGEAIPVLGEWNLNQARRNGFLCARR